MEDIRSFIAIELPASVQEELTRLQAKLRAATDFYVKWVESSGIHLTLKFLGYVPADRLDEIKLAMEVAAEGIPPFRLQVGGLGAFPSLSRVQVVWVAVSGDIEPLARLVQRLESELDSLGFPPEARAFTPHLTLARMGNRAMPEERRRLGEVISRTTFTSGSTIDVSEVSLMRSQLTREGAIYTRIGAVRLRTS